MMCYVGKATKIFVSVVTILVFSGLVLGFVLLRHGHQKLYSHDCDGDSCRPLPNGFPNPISTTNTPPFSSYNPPSPDTGSNSPPSPPAVEDPTPPPPPPIITDPSPPPPELPTSAAPPPPVLPAPPYNQPAPMLAAPGPVHA